MKFVKKRKVVEVTEEVDIQLPMETCYFFDTGERQSIRIVPNFLYNKESLEENLIDFQITTVYFEFSVVKIERGTLSIRDIQEMLLEQQKINNKNSVMNSYIKKHLYVRTKEQFENDLNAAIIKLKEEE